jgi:glycolate oxidase FAD binding subunit
MQPATPATPTGEEELVAMIRDAARSRRGLITEGSGTKAHFGPSLSREVPRVSLRAMKRIVAYEPGDMVVSVEAGATMQELQLALAEHDQWLPVDPPFPDATVGGVLATHSSGPRRLGYGTVKDMLLGTRVVGAGGQVSRSGGRVVKNVSGYDLHKLHVGAFGSLGVLVEAAFRVCARPEVAAVVWISKPTLEAAHQMLLDVASTPLRPCALEALDGPSANVLAENVPELPKGSPLAIVGIEGSGPIVERHLRDLARLRSEAPESGVIEGPRAERVWEAFRDLPVRYAGDITVRVAARPEELRRLLAEIPPTSVRRTGTVVQAALGIARVSMSVLPDSEPLATELSMWQRLARERGGYAVVESAPLGCPGRDRLPFGWRVDHALGAAIRGKWDPDEVLNPGRMAC